MNIDRILTIASIVAALLIGSMQSWITMVASAAPEHRKSMARNTMAIIIVVLYAILLVGSAMLFSSGEYGWSVAASAIAVLGCVGYYWFASTTASRRETVLMVLNVSYFIVMFQAVIFYRLVGR